MTSSAKLVLRTLSDLDYANTRQLMAERFSRHDLQMFIEMWHWRNWSASLCIEHMGAILGFALVVDNKLEYLVVSDKCEGRGFGRFLLKFVVNMIKAQEYRGTTLMTANDPTLRTWYGRQGFELSSTTTDSDGICGDVMVYRYRVKRAAAKKSRYAS
jgi:GNAT superfamily N-acetyltransferase